MKVETTPLAGLLVIEPRRFADSRGFFMESYNQQAFDEAVGSPVRFVQDNCSRSLRHVLRGMHFQQAPRAQGKLVRVARGRVFDVALDIRAASPTFGRHFGIELDDQDHRQLWIPAGFAHGFLVLSEEADFVYKTTDFWSAVHERSIRWNDPTAAIDWPLEGAPMLSDKDAAAPLLEDLPLRG